MRQALFLGYIYSQKAIEKLKVVKSFLRFLVPRIQPNSKKIHQSYIHGSSKYPKILKDFSKIYSHYLAYCQIKWLNLLVSHCQIFFLHKKFDKNIS
jgi:hypothetical protein